MITRLNGKESHSHSFMFKFPKCLPEFPPICNFHTQGKTKEM